MHDFRQDLAVVFLKPGQPLTIRFRSGRSAFARPDIAEPALPGSVVRALPAGSVIAKDECQAKAVPIPRRREEEPGGRAGHGNPNRRIINYRCAGHTKLTTKYTKEGNENETKN